jgi:hypothetical protein
MDHMRNSKLLGLFVKILFNDFFSSSGYLQPVERIIANNDLEMFWKVTIVF